MSTQTDSYLQFISALEREMAELRKLLAKRWPDFQTWLEEAQTLIVARAEAAQIDRHIDRLLVIVIGTPAAALVRRLGLDVGIRLRTPLGAGQGRGTLDSGYGWNDLVQVTRAKESMFHFLLRGAHARGPAILVGSEADLIFNYDIPPEDALTISNEKLDKARVADVDIGLHLTEVGSITIKGERYAVAKFKEGRMLEAVTFRLAATGPVEARSLVQVVFTVRGETIHQADIVLKVVATEEELENIPSWYRWAHTVGPVLLNEAVNSSTPPNQRIKLSLSFDGNCFCIDLEDLRDGETWHRKRFVSKDIGSVKLEGLLNKVRSELSSSYVSADFWNGFDGDVSTCAKLGGEKALKRTRETVASAGWKLWDALGEDEKIKAALCYVEANAKNGARITIDTENVFLPWEIMYPSYRTKNMTEKEEAEYPLKPELFWGVRFAFETFQRGDFPVGQLQGLHRKARPKVSVNLNPTIKLEKLVPDAQPIALQRGWATRLSAKGLLEGVVNDSCKLIGSVLKDAAVDAKIIYVYCHGRPAAPLTAGTAEALQLDDGCELTPDDLSPTLRYKNAPIIVLNACQAGAISPITFSNFLKEFCQRGALGLVATTASIPILFGARFGEELVQRCLERKGVLADELLDLRKEHLLNRGNPVPLFYTIQCLI